MATKSNRAAVKRPAKPLKLKRFVTEEEGASLLSHLIGEEINAEDMHEYALAGVVPAYMKYAPKDREKYQETGFRFVEIDRFSELDASHQLGVESAEVNAQDKAIVETLTTSDSLACSQVLPYPLLAGGYVAERSGERWRVFVGRADGGLEKVGAEHFVRVYSPPELCQIAQILNDPTACPEWPAVLHSHAMVREDELDGFDENGPFDMLSPFDEHLYFLIPEAGKTRAAQPSKLDLDPRERASMERMIYLLAKMARLDLALPYKAAEAMALEAGFEGLEAPSEETVKKYLQAADSRAKEEANHSA